MRDNNYECAKIRLLLNDNNIYHPFDTNKDIFINDIWNAEKEKSWEEKAREYKSLYYKDFNGVCIKDYLKKVELFEKALEEKKNEIEVLTQSIKILQNENLIHRNSQFEWGEKYIKLKDQIEKMKCCNNCRYDEHDEGGKGCLNENPCDDKYSGWELKE